MLLQKLFVERQLTAREPLDVRIHVGQLSSGTVSSRFQQFLLVPPSRARVDPRAQVLLQHLDLCPTLLQTILCVRLFYLTSSLLSLLPRFPRFVFSRATGGDSFQNPTSFHEGRRMTLDQLDRVEPLLYRPRSIVRGLSRRGAVGSAKFARIRRCRFVAASRLLGRWFRPLRHARFSTELGFYRKFPRTLVPRQKNLARTAATFQHDLLERDLVYGENANFLPILALLRGDLLA